MNWYRSISKESQVAESDRTLRDELKWALRHLGLSSRRCDCEDEVAIENLEIAQECVRRALNMVESSQ